MHIIGKVTVCKQRLLFWLAKLSRTSFWAYRRQFESFRTTFEWVVFYFANQWRHRDLSYSVCLSFWLDGIDTFNYCVTTKILAIWWCIPYFSLWVHTKWQQFWFLHAVNKCKDRCSLWQMTKFPIFTKRLRNTTSSGSLAWKSGHYWSARWHLAIATTSYKT